MFRYRILKRIDEIGEKLMLEVDAANSKMVAKTEEEIEGSVFGYEIEFM
jgi:hypothetical protein